MTKDEFKTKIETEKPYLGDRKIILNKFVPGSFILGLYFSEQDNIWKIYETTERGSEYVIFTTNREEEAYDLLYKLIIFHKS